MAKDAPALAHFAKLVRRYREQAGFETARDFYEALGGKEKMGVGFKAYANVERGLSVPQPALVERLVAAFRLAHSPERSREFAMAYLRVLLGFDEMLEFAVQVLTTEGAVKTRAPSDGKAPKLTPEQKAALEDGGGEILMDHPTLLRAKESELRAYLPYLAQCVAAAELCAGSEDAKDAGVFAVEVALTHLLSY
ncbi:MAG: hypothetical protein HY553_03815 [Elusimicrobia bacterium]|nr:hypothetical protein [Elusimicrobiota bacterium]